METERNQWPRFIDWAFVVLTTVLGAAEFQIRSSQTRTQSGTSYYFEEPGVATLHTLALVVDALAFLAVAGWIASRRPRFFRGVLVGVAISGFSLAWYEALRAASLETVVYTLDKLPYFPINNYGLVGAQLFGSYLVFAIPSSLGGRAWVMSFVKAALCVCLWFAQIGLWLVLA